MNVDPSTRIRRVEAIPRRPGRSAGEVAMLRRPSLVAFAGSCARAEPHVAFPANDNVDGDLGEVEPAPSRPAPEELQLDAERAAPTPIEDFTAGIVANAAEAMAMLAEHRVTRPMSRRPSREGRILTLVDAIFATGERAIADVLGWWERMRDDGGPWVIWPPVFLLGLLEGPDGLFAIERLVESLRPEDGAAVQVVADALVVGPHPGLGALAEDLLDAENPVARAIGIELLARSGALDVERITSLLDLQAPAVLAAAVRALVRAEGAPPSIERVIPLLAHPDADVAWEAARAVTLWGAPTALRAVREGQPLAATLGPRAAELFVMAGDADDVAHLEALVARSPMSAELLDAIGRFGHPLAWSFLLHFLTDRDLGHAAEGALRTLFGPLVSPEAARTPGVWREALADADLDPSLRYREGKPWAPSTVALRDGTKSQRALERWLDELAARTGIAMSIDAALWTPDVNTKLLAVSEQVLRARWHAETWSGDRGAVERRGS
jgi:hypothetical protein